MNIRMKEKNVWMDNDKKTITKPRRKNFIKDDKQKKKRRKKWRTCCVPMPCLNTCHEILSQESISEDSIFTYFRSPPSCAFTVTSKITSVVIAIFETCYCRVMWSDSDTGNLSSFLAGKIGKWWREFWTFSRDFFVLLLTAVCEKVWI